MKTNGKMVDDFIKSDTDEYDEVLHQLIDLTISTGFQMST